MSSWLPSPSIIVVFSFDTWIKHYRQDENSINSTVSYYRKGAVIAAANCAAFCGILASGAVGNLLNNHLMPTDSFALMGATAVAGGAVVLAAVWREEKRC